MARTVNARGLASSADCFEADTRAHPIDFVELLHCQKPVTSPICGAADAPTNLNPGVCGNMSPRA